MTETKGASKVSFLLKIVLAVLAVTALVLAARTFDVQQHLKSALQWIAGLGPFGPAAFATIYVLACVLLIPAWILTLGAGVVFGVVKGSVIVSISSILGASAAFLVGRHLARDRVARKIEGNARFKAIDEAVGREGWKIVFLTRLSPVFPFNLQNYAYGLTRVRFRHYFVASWIGMIPGTILYVYIGSLAGSLAALGQEERDRSPLEWTLYGIGLAATVAVTLQVTKLARRALRKHIDA